MKTRMLSPGDAEVAGEILRRGGLVAIPTETVYGLAANALNGEAVANIFKAKGRPMDNPLIVHITELEQLEDQDLVAYVPSAVYDLAEAYWPGPLTIIMEKGSAIPDEVSAGLDTVAIRMGGRRAAGCPFRQYIRPPEPDDGGPRGRGHGWQDRRHCRRWPVFCGRRVHRRDTLY